MKSSTNVAMYRHFSHTETGCHLWARLPYEDKIVTLTTFPEGDEASQKLCFPASDLDNVIKMLLGLKDDYERFDKYGIKDAIIKE